MAAQFDLCRLPNRTLVVLLQDDLAEWTATRVAAPVIPATRARTMPRILCPVVDFGEEPHAIPVPSLSSVMTVSLSPPLYSLARYRDDIIRALDLLFTGV
jgi:toxin CcdB